ncbi:MAG TPA: hypothetical protein VGR97_10820 [Candidatus Acidoferrales bacterium]|nr:hypothetical protein [Candidatus Acidoferrales bacterium]
MSFLANGEKRFAIDVVPAFTSGTKNEFGDEIFWVPEILETSIRKRATQYVKLLEAKKTEREWWLRSDPLGYIRIAADLNALNGDFRKTTKFIKRWKYNCEARSDDFSLKSFHIEQVLLEIYKQNPGVSIFDALFGFLYDIPKIIAQPQIRDRANHTKFIDDYVKDLTGQQRKRIIQARDYFLIELENIPHNSSVAGLLGAGFHERADPAEQYLFDSRIPALVDPSANLQITATVLPRDGFRAFVLSALGIINIDRKIQFRANIDYGHPIDLQKWKVKNDNKSPQPRGEITDHVTRNDPELTKYNGSHFVECYGIKDGVCIARARQNVVLKHA